MALPLTEMGRRLAVMAKELAAGKVVEPVTRLACDLMVGESVAKFNGGGAREQSRA
jgi:hypothetical protein